MQITAVIIEPTRTQMVQRAPVRSVTDTPASVNAVAVDSSGQVNVNSGAVWKNGTASVSRGRGRYYVEFELMQVGNTDALRVGLRMVNSAFSVLGDVVAELGIEPNGTSSLKTTITASNVNTHGSPLGAGDVIGVAIEFYADGTAGAWFGWGDSNGFAWEVGVPGIVQAHVDLPRGQYAPAVSLRRRSSVHIRYSAEEQLYRPAGWLSWDGLSLHVATATYVTRPGDTPASTAFLGRVLSSPVFTRSLDCSIWGAAGGRLNSGVMRLANNDGALNELLETSARDRLVRVYYVGIGDAFSAAFFVGTLYVDTSAGDGENEIRVTLKDRNFLLETDVNPVGLPYIVGAPLSVYCDPRDTPALSYAVSDSALENVNLVRDRGASVAFTDDATGFVLTLEPDGRVVADVTGTVSGGFAAGTLRAELHRLLIARLGIPSGDVLTTLVADFETANPGELAASYANTVTAQAVLRDLVNSYVGWYTWGADNRLAIGRFDFNAAPEFALRDNEIIGEIERRFDRQEGATDRAGAARNHVPMLDSELIPVGAAMTLADRAMLQREYRIESIGRSAISAEYSFGRDVSAGDRLRIGTLGQTLARAQAAANFRSRAASQRRDFYDVRLGLSPARLAVFASGRGKVWQIDRAVFDLLGKPVFLVFDEFGEDGTINATFWG